MTTTGPATAGQDGAALVRRAFEAFNAADVDACGEFLHDDFLINLMGAPYQMRGRAAWRQNMAVMQEAFPGIQAEIEDLFSEGDRIAVRLTFRGTHRGEFQGVPATGRHVEYTSIELYRTADGRLAEEWIASDIPTLMRQLTGPEHEETDG